MSDGITTAIGRNSADRNPADKSRVLFNIRSRLAGQLGIGPMGLQSTQDGARAGGSSPAR